MSGHACHAIGCTRQIAPRFLFCPEHWGLVPRNLQRMIWAVYRNGQELDKDPSGVYLAAQAHVVAYVAVRTGRWTTEHAVEHVMKRLGALVAREMLTHADIEKLARFDPNTFAGFAASLRS